MKCKQSVKRLLKEHFTQKERNMALESHLIHLLERHSKLDQEIHQNELMNTDDISVHDMKKQKLKLKEEIERLKLHTKPEFPSFKEVH